MRPLGIYYSVPFGPDEFRYEKLESSGALVSYFNPNLWPLGHCRVPPPYNTILLDILLDLIKSVDFNKINEDSSDVIYDSVI